MGPSRRLGAAHGGLSGSPVQYMFPVDAMTPRSVAFQPERRAVESERGDGDPHRLRRSRSDRLRAPRPTRGVDHRIGPGEEFDQAWIVRSFDLDRLLARVPDPEAQRAPVAGERGDGAKRVATLWFDLRHLGAEVREDAARHRGWFACQVDHCQALRGGNRSRADTTREAPEPATGLVPGRQRDARPAATLTRTTATG